MKLTILSEDWVDKWEVDFFGLVFVALFKDDGVFLQPSLTSANVAYYDTFNYLR
jgi:hypothetical protein